MRRRLIDSIWSDSALVLALLLVPLALAQTVAAEPVAGAGYAIEALSHDLALPSGCASDGGALILTDLATGNVVRRAANGRLSLIHAGLPTGTDVMGHPTGPYKVQVRKGRVLVAQGWQDVKREEGPLDHALLEIRPGGAPKVISKAFWNPYDFAWGGDAWYIADAGRNALMKLTEDGNLAEVFAFPDLKHKRSELQALSPTEFKDGGETYEVDAVPTGVAIAGGRVYVALFGGFPYLAGGGLVTSVPKSGKATRARVEVEGLNAPIDVALDTDGRLLVLEMGLFELDKGFVPGSGRLLAVELGSGKRHVLLSGLTQPVTVAPTGDGATVIVEMSGGLLRLERAR